MDRISLCFLGLAQNLTKSTGDCAEAWISTQDPTANASKHLVRGRI